MKYKFFDGSGKSHDIEASSDVEASKKCHMLGTGMLFKEVTLVVVPRETTLQKK